MEILIGRFLSYRRRRWAYAVIEIIPIAIFGLCFSVVFSDRAYRIGINDPGMARITAACFMAVSAVLFVLAVCLKKIDRE